jgi:hypothetical protein
MSHGFPTKVRCGRAAAVVVLFAAAAAPLMSGCQTSEKLSLSMPLMFRPERVTSASVTPVAASPGLKLHIPAATDARPNQDTIGENIENAEIGPRPIYADGPTPAEFVHAIVEREMAKVGYVAAPGAGTDAANRVLAITINDFYAIESSRYKAEVRLSAEVRDGGGRVIWRGQGYGDSARFGRSLSPENYNESFSDATLRALGQIMANPQFQAAMTVE